MSGRYVIPMQAAKEWFDMPALYGQALKDYITSESRKYGVDPRATLSVASVEGQFSGAIGDAGTSFGPFQLHIGGALPAGKSPRWANTKAGVTYAIQKIAGVARGLHGKKAVTAIVYKFERPASPAAEVDRAMAVYKSPASKPGPSVGTITNPATLPKPAITTAGFDIPGWLFPGAEGIGGAAGKAADTGEDAYKAVGGISGLADAIRKPENWLRVGYGIAGVVCVFFAINYMSLALGSESGLLEKASKLVGLAATKGKSAVANSPE